MRIKFILTSLVVTVLVFVGLNATRTTDDYEIAEFPIVTTVATADIQQVSPSSPLVTADPVATKPSAPKGLTLKRFIRPEHTREYILARDTKSETPNIEMGTIKLPLPEELMDDASQMAIQKFDEAVRVANEKYPTTVKEPAWVLNPKPHNPNDPKDLERGRKEEQEYQNYLALNFIEMSRNAPKHTLIESAKLQLAQELGEGKYKYYIAHERACSSIIPYSLVEDGMEPVDAMAIAYQIPHWSQKELVKVFGQERYNDLEMVINCIKTE